MIRLLRQQALLAFVAGAVFLTWLGRYGLFNDGESTTAGCAAEMFRQARWIIPTFNEHLKSDHPILVYWQTLLAYRWFGVSEFAARVPSSMLAIGTVLVTYHLGRKLYSQEVGLFGGLILCTCVIFASFGRAATPDAAVVFFETLAVSSYVWVIAAHRGGNFNGLGSSVVPVDPALSNESDSNEQSDEIAKPSAPIRPDLKPLIFPRWPFAVPMYVSMGMAVLATGLDGFLRPFSTIVLFLLVSLRRIDLKNGTLKSPEGRWWRQWLVAVWQTVRRSQVIEVARGMHLLVGLGIVAAIALPWYVAIGIDTDGVWPRAFFFDHNTHPISNLSAASIWFVLRLIYLLILVFIVCLPWSVFVGIAIGQMRDRMEDEHSFWQFSDRLITCWVFVWFLSVLHVRSEVPNFLLPICPAVALILGRYFQDWQRDEGDAGVYLFNLCCKAFAISGGIMIVGFYIAAYLYFPSEEWLSLIGAIPLAGGFAAMKFVDLEKRRLAFRTLLAAAALTAFLIVGVGPCRIAKYQDAPQLIADARRLAGTTDVQIGTYDHFEPAIVFYAGQTVPQLSSSREVAEFLSRHRHAFVISKANKENDLRDELRGDLGEVARHRSFLGREELILIGRR